MTSFVPLGFDNLTMWKPYYHIRLAVSDIVEVLTTYFLAWIAYFKYIRSIAFL